MSLSSKAGFPADTRWAACLAIGLPLLAMFLLGLDASWDLRNYHLYNVHAWLTGRMHTDIAPAQLQSWHNPLLDLPLYWLTMSGLGARWASAWLTVPTIAAIFFLLRMQPLLSDEARPSRLSQAVLALLALTGAATYSTLAISTNDAFVAAALLASLFIILNDEQVGHTHRRWLWAGLVAGAITGLKLAAIFYCIALALSSLVGGNWRQRLRKIASLALGGALGFAATYAWWGWKLYAIHRNPFFPYYNDFFRSPDVLPNAFADARFRAGSLEDVLLAPIRLLHNSQRFSELTLRDPRLLIGALALLALLVLYRRRFSPASPLRHRIGILAVFFFSSLLLWARQYGIYRYAITLELLGCLALVALLQWLPRGRNIALLVAFVLVSADTRRPDWGRVKVDAPRAGLTTPAIPADSLVVIASQEPLAYVALGLPRSVPLVAVYNNLLTPGSCTGLQVRGQQAIARHSGPIWLLNAPEDAARGQSLVAEFYGLHQSGECTPVSSSLGTAMLCPQRRTTTPARCDGATP